MQIWFVNAYLPCPLITNVQVATLHLSDVIIASVCSIEHLTFQGKREPYQQLTASCENIGYAAQSGYRRYWPSQDESASECKMSSLEISPNENPSFASACALFRNDLAGSADRYTVNPFDNLVPVVGQESATRTVPRRAYSIGSICVRKSLMYM